MKVDDLFTKRPESVKAMWKVQEFINICEVQGHIIQNCPTLIVLREHLMSKTMPLLENNFNSST